MPRRFCARCGKPLENFTGSFFCQNCRQEGREEPRGEELSVYICPLCKRYSETGASPGFWKEIPPQTRDRPRLYIIREAFKDNPALAACSIHFLENIGGAQVYRIDADPALEAPVVFLKYQEKSKACPVCSKKAGRSFASTLQIRTRGPKFRAVLRQMVAEVLDLIERLNAHDPKNFLIKYVEKENGADFQLSEKALAHKLANALKSRFPVKVTHSKRLMGRDPQTGGSLFRYKVSCRLLPVLKGTILNLDSVPYKVTGIDQTVVLENLERDEVLHKKFTFFFKRKFTYFHIPGDPLEEFTFVSETRDTYQYMNVRSCELLEIPQGKLQNPRTSLKGLVIHGNLHVIEEEEKEE